VNIPGIIESPSSPVVAVRFDSIPAKVTVTARSAGSDASPKIELVQAKTFDARDLGASELPRYHAFEYFTLAGVLTNAAGQVIPGGTVQISAPGLLFSTGAPSESLRQNFAVGSITVTSSDTGEYSVQVRSNFAGEQILVVRSGSKTTAKVLTFDDAQEGTGTQLVIEAPQIAKDSSFVVAIQLKDVFGNRVQTSATGTFSLSYSGPGTPSSIPLNLDAAGFASFRVDIGENDHGTGTITASFDGDSDPRTLENNIVEKRLVYVGDLSLSGADDSTSSVRKVTVGSFKGFVVVYTLGYEGHRLSAKIGKDWVIVPSIPAVTHNLFRWAEKVGFGVDCAVRIFVDKVLIQTVYLTTK
jgi:hypothetical protein